jgi:dipeptidyl aminopeptidase/acylaminoacyl peptidase
MSYGAAEPWRAEAEAHKRAMPMQRLLGNGMDYADGAALYARVDDGRPWHEAAAELGIADRQRAETALARGHRESARSWYEYAAACYRVGQVPLDDANPAKREMYRALIGCYAAAGSLRTPPAEHIKIGWGGGTLYGWLLRPARVERPATVIVMGGFDGWREEYHVGATYLLERGIAVFLADGPGQGESRLFGGLHMAPGVEKAFSAMVDRLLADDRLSGRLGIWGNSMGGYLAALVAASDDRVAACCVNGGTVRPAETLDRFHRFVSKLQLLLGIDDPDTARAAMEQFVLDTATLAALTCPLLVLHGIPDQVFLVENARALFDGAASSDKTWRAWPDGDHCIYNHSHEKHTLIGDWFAERLQERQP